MAKPIIFVDSITIGLFLFKGYIYEDENANVCFGIFIDGNENPLVSFEKDEEDVVHIVIEINLLAHISKVSISNKNQRKANFKQFSAFLKESEHVAANMVFKGRQMKYLSKSKNLLEMRNIYVNGASQ